MHLIFVAHTTDCDCTNYILMFKVLLAPAMVSLDEHCQPYHRLCLLSPCCCCTFVKYCKTRSVGALRPPTSCLGLLTSSFAPFGCSGQVTHAGITEKPLKIWSLDGIQKKLCKILKKKTRSFSMNLGGSFQEVKSQCQE